MKKFGLSKKDKSAGGSPAPDDDANRSALFGSRKAKAPPAGGNPYAAGGGNPYASGGGSYGGMGAPPAYDGQLSDQQRNEKSPVPSGGYGSNRFAGGGSGYDSQGGYGGNRYGDSGYGGSSGSSASRRPGGYGGLGGGDDGDDSNRNALFGNAGDRYQQRSAAPQGTMSSQQRPQGGGYGQSGMGAAYGEDGTGYGAYQDRQL
jgi:protein transport protein SEC9